MRLFDWLFVGVYVVLFYKTVLCNTPEERRPQPQVGGSQNLMSSVQSAIHCRSLYAKRLKLNWFERLT